MSGEVDLSPVYREAMLLTSNKHVTSVYPIQWDVLPTPVTRWLWDCSCGAKTKSRGIRTQGMAIRAAGAHADCEWRWNVARLTRRVPR